MLGDMTGKVLWDDSECQLSSVDTLMTWGYVGWSSLDPKWIWRLRLAWQATMAAGDSLPTRNEDYGTREYWCALTHLFVLFLNFFLNI